MDEDLPAMPLDRIAHSDMLGWVEQVHEFFAEQPTETRLRCGAQASSSDWRCERFASAMLADVPLCDVHQERLRKWIRAAVRDREDQHASDAAGRALRRHRRRRAQESVVYFLEREGFVKIGTTTRLPARLRTLEGGSGTSLPDGMTVGPMELLLTMSGGEREEKELHARFAEFRFAGEWFLYEGALRGFVEESCRMKTAQLPN